MTKLNDKQQLFADKYIETLNATQSAIYAGYSEKTAHVQGCTLLKNPKLKSYIEDRVEARKVETIASADEVLEFLTAVARGEIEDVSIS